MSDRRGDWVRFFSEPGVDLDAEADKSEPVKLEAFGCYVWLVEGGLIACEINDYEPAGDDTYAVDVSAPESQEFLDAVNAALGTTFQMDQFEGR